MNADDDTRGARIGAPRFLVDEIDAAAGAIDLPAAEVKHARVRRLHNGAEVVVFDGRGTSYRGRIESYSRDAVRVALIEAMPARAAESPLAITLAVAVLKADRLDWVIEKTTELGVARIVPFECEHSLARPSSARQTRWRSIAAGAAKQCGRSIVPTVEPCVSFAAVVERASDRKLLFWEGAGMTERLSEKGAPSQVLAIVGPEGGFTAGEAAAAQSAGSQVVSLGPRILRADTAAISAAALCQHLWGDV
jgi:16S rRNA (uracil1498-N3)-methyltransferase